MSRPRDLDFRVGTVRSSGRYTLVRRRSSVDLVGTRGLFRLVAVVAGLAVAGGLGVSSAFAAAGDIGYPGKSFGTASAPTGEKPESKLWFNDGIWWGSMWEPVKQDNQIFRLDLATQTWNDTGVRLDDRKSKADVLWDGQKLYVASHVYTSAPASGTPSRLYRYSYDSVSKAYSLDPGFPVTINNFKLETLVIDKDSTGTLWATWVASGKVWATHSAGSDLLWVAPFALPVADNAVSSDDISSLIPFGGNKIGVMWSDQSGAQSFHFAVHADGAPDSAWSAELVPGISNADDHINLKTVAGGRIYAAVKRDTASPDLLTELLVRDPDGTWFGYSFGTSKDSHTRPIVLVDEEHGGVFMYGTGPAPGTTSGQSGGTIYQKGSPIGSIVLQPGLGSAVINDAVSPKMNNATSTKQNVSSATGIVVLAGDDTTDKYWHAYRTLVPEPANAQFNVPATTGGAPFAVEFDDSSTAGLFGPSSWLWDFGDGQTSTEKDPTHVYTTPGTYSVSLTVSDGLTSDTETKLNFITVLPGLSFAPEADAFVKSNSATSKYGTQPTLRARLGTADSPTTYRSFVRFNVTGITSPIVSATLRMYVADASKDGGAVALAANTWVESTVTWNLQPAFIGSVLDSNAVTLANSWIEWDVTAAVTGDGVYTFGLTSSLTDAAYYVSKEGGANIPELKLVLGSP